MKEGIEKVCFFLQFFLFFHILQFYFITLAGQNFKIAGQPQTADPTASLFSREDSLRIPTERRLRRAHAG